MEIKGKKKTVTSVFFRYACFYTAGVLFLIFLLFLIWFVLEVTGEVLPANHMEIRLNEAADQIRKTPRITKEMLPEGCIYGVYEGDGSWLYGTFPSEEIKQAWEKYQRNDIYAHGRGYYRFFLCDSGEVCIARYKIRTQFQNGFLEKFLPSPDLLMVCSFIVLFLLHTVLMSRRFGKYMKNKLVVLNEVTAKIRNQNLEFEEEHSELKEVDEVLNSLNQMKEALKASLYRQWSLEKSREEQIAALAHDIKTPLTVIRGNGELLAEAELGKEEREYNQDILQSVSMIEEYLVTLNEILAEDEGESGVQNQTISCDALLELFMEQGRLLSSARQYPVIFDAKAVHGEVWCSVSQLLRAFNNILSNAMDYSPAKGEIKVSLEIKREHKGEYLVITVLDEGPGFTAQDLKHATDRFYQGDDSRSRKNHYGIGLHTAEKFVRAQGGYLAIDNAENHGAKVSIFVQIH